MKNKQNIITALAIGFGTLLFLLISFSLNTEAQKKITNQDIVKWQEATSSGEFVVTVLASTGCGHCQNYKPVITKLAEKYGFNLFFYELEELKDEEIQILKETYTLENNQGYVPYTFVVNGNKFIADNTGALEEDAAKDFLTKAGYVFEN